MNPKETIENFWQVMNTNDFQAASHLLAEDYELLWPQSAERIRGRANFVGVNASYPAKGRWRFTIDSLVAEEGTVVSDVSVTDGVVSARAITFSTVAGGLITRQVEYWPDEYAAPEWRSQWVEPA